MGRVKKGKLVSFETNRLGTHENRGMTEFVYRGERGIREKLIEAKVLRSDNLRPALAQKKL